MESQVHAQVHVSEFHTNKYGSQRFRNVELVGFSCAFSLAPWRRRQRERAPVVVQSPHSHDFRRRDL